MEKVLKKLGHKGPVRTLLQNPPEAIAAALTPLLGEAVDQKILGIYDFALVFVTSLDAFLPLRAPLVAAMAGQSRLWICYPKKSSPSYRSDLSRDILWPTLGEFDWEPVSQYAIDEDWSAMRFRPVDEIGSLTRSKASSDKARQRLQSE